jgi:tRNA/rRNA methyltransferase
MNINNLTHSHLTSSKSPLNNINIVLCNTSHHGNIGASARAMKTMGLYNLTLVAPLSPPDDHSMALACNAQDVIKTAIITNDLDQVLANKHLAIALTSRKREFNHKLATPKEIVPEILNAVQAQQQVALIFGNEQHGLTIEQLEKCNRLVTIPGNPEYSSLNLAQAVQIMAYEIYSTFNPKLEHLVNPVQKANLGDTNYLLNSLDQIMQFSGYYKNKNISRVLRQVQKILHKADLERNEADLLHGILNSIKKSGNNHVSQ